MLYAEFSPAGGYITTAQRSVKTEGEAPKKNIQVSTNHNALLALQYTDQMLCKAWALCMGACYADVQQYVRAPGASRAVPLQV